MGKRTTNDSESVSVQYLKDFTAGWAGGIAQVLVGQPFDTIKVRLQTQSDLPSQSSLNSTPAVKMTNPVNANLSSTQTQAMIRYSSPLDCAVKTIRSEGISGLYRGTLMPLLGVGLCVSIQFSALEAMKRTFTLQESSSSTTTTSLTPFQFLVSGSVAGLLNTIVAGPVEHVRIRCQVANRSSALSELPQFNGPVQCAKQIYSRYGWSGIYRGQLATMIRDGIGFGSYFLLYEYLIQSTIQNENRRNSLIKNGEFKREDLPSWKLISYGALAGVAFWFSVYPVDVIKSKLQTDALEPSRQSFKGIIDCFNKTIKMEGFKGLFKGFTPCMLRAAPVNAATFVAFEMTMRALNAS